jgi:hypothetical protein
MPRIFELAKSGKGTEEFWNANAEGIYMVTGISDPLELRLYVEEQLSGTYLHMAARKYSVEPVSPDIWQVTVPYEQRLPEKKDKDRPTGSKKLSFEIGGGTQTVKYSLQTMANYARDGAPGSAPDYEKAINVSQQGEPDGTDIYVPSFTFSIKKYLPKAAMTSAYIKKLFQMCATTNNGDWVATDDQISIDFVDQEVLFLGVSGSERNDDDYDLDFKFAASPGLEDGTAGSITGINKKGWEYLWAQFKPVEHPTDLDKTIWVPYYVYVERMYKPTNFADLGLN